jgi:ubiquinone/menaquinone biosynthesis C-methylase UbiE
MTEPNKPEYLFGANEKELERLHFQHNVWRSVTEGFFSRIGVKEGWKCLDVGAGPGFVTMDLRKRIGEKGEITALEPMELFLDRLKNEAERKSWRNIKFINGSVEQSWLPENYYNLIFVRWVMSFVSFPFIFLERLISSLAPGGIIAIEDYAYEGLSLYPRGGACEHMADALRKYYKENRGDLFIAARLPSMYKEAGLEIIDYTPNCLAGGPESGVFEWAHGFFTMYIPIMADKGIISRQMSDDMIMDWRRHRENPDSIFFSPIVVDAAGKKPG